MFRPLLAPQTRRSICNFARQLHLYDKVPPEKALPVILWTQHVQTLYRYSNTQFGSIWGLIDRDRMCKVEGRTGRRSGNLSDDQRLLSDHLAMRTFNLPGVSLDDFDPLLKRIGFEQRDVLHFPNKHLRARWYAPPAQVPWLPRVFLSELLVDRLSDDVARRIVQLTATGRALRRTTQASFRQQHPAFDNPHYSSTPLSALALQLAAEMQQPLLSEPLSRSDYEAIAAETEYGAWTLINGNRVNHGTIPVHWLSAPYDSLRDFMDYASTQWGVEFHDNGAIQCSEDGLLLQSSTPAQSLEYQFNDERTKSAVPGSFVEFIERRREGFEVGNAERIFESTDAQK